MERRFNRWKIAALLRELSSESEQRRLWLSDGSGGSDISSFAEACEQLFTDTGIGDELDANRCVFGEPVDAGLKQLRALLAKVDTDCAPAVIILSQRMGEVRVFARALVEQLIGAVDAR